MFDTQDLPATVAPPTDASSPPRSGKLAACPSARSTRALFKHRRLAGAAFVLVVGVMMLQTYSQVPMYRTSSRVMIQDERTVAVGNLNANDPAFWQDSDPYFNTQYSILRSRGLARRVVRKLQLQNHPLFNGTAPQRQGIGDDDRRRAAQGQHDRAIAAPPAAAAPPVEPPSPDEEAAEAGIISQFLGGVRIVPEAKTRLVEIVYESSDPQFAALAANTLAEEYTAQNLELRLGDLSEELAMVERGSRRSRKRRSPTRKRP